jgi:hypothetical protein
LPQILNAGKLIDYFDDVTMNVAVDWLTFLFSIREVVVSIIDPGA